MFVFESSQGRFMSLYLWRVDEHVSTSLIYIFHIHAVWSVSDHRHTPLSSPGHLEFHGSSPLFRHHCRKKKCQKEINFPLFLSRFSQRILWNVKDFVLTCTACTKLCSYMQNVRTVHVSIYEFITCGIRVNDPFAKICIFFVWNWD